MSYRDKYETVIGLEVHVQLNTKTKVFCGCSNLFGAGPNTQVCPVCLGMPGVLPVLNKQALALSIKIALALGCDIQKNMKFDRKNYYYPDLPKNYQISQYDMPLAFKGCIDIELEDGSAKRIGVTRAHMEEDAGKLMHDTGGVYSLVDLNRTGTPLLEIVSEPDIRTPQEAHSYLTVLKQIIKYLGASDCNMEEGSLRCDANISVRLRGEKKLGTKVEIKNMNSFKAVKDALTHEEDRQMDLLEDGEKIMMETRLWDDKKGVTASMRAKEESHDYRYFPEPDLVPFEISHDLMEDIRLSLPELPDKKFERFMNVYKLDKKDIEVIILEREVADFYEDVVKGFNDAQNVANWVKGEVMMHMNERGVDIAGLKLAPADLASLVKMAKEGALSYLVAKEVLRECIDTGKKPESIVAEKGLRQVSDQGEIEKIVDQVIAANPKSVEDLKAGKENAISFLVGQVMKMSKGKANPRMANEILRSKLVG
ncbi:MAG TPA: Asp-tRNA(Asn)/Glu-tRNA(Gln) amidotransferase subunit GatB [Candidatus Omnitrophota bacterium]|nr:Asp-tRNA(Asn)/Glu-tRNA(Gln) amidotransferase subunit GatB [Candidatus Omnitrophota bacterium]HPS19926.1 Asp-tRNA(Asn)/Glu-tRNA(Gln) amidotransferase subunit GatB [Candidatus Omnitrophota bacterium]